MEGYLEIYNGIITRWKMKYFVLHRAVLTYCDEKGQKVQGSVHLRVATLQIRPEEPLQIIINTGTHEMVLKAANYVDKNKWATA